MDILTQIVEKIIQEQEKIIGPIALEQAKKVQGLSVDLTNHKITIAGNEKKVVEKLVKQYALFFGRASVEVCKDAARTFSDKASTSELPDILRS